MRYQIFYMSFCNPSVFLPYSWIEVFFFTLKTYNHFRFPWSKVLNTYQVSKDVSLI